MSTTAPSIAPSSPEMDCTKEVRFATVMYGGVSLAIYINGVAQELFHLVRSTAKDESGNRALLRDAPKAGASKSSKQLSGTERVYRKLSYLLSDERLLGEYRQFLKQEITEGNGKVSESVQADETDTRAKVDRLLVENKQAINTRFVVDIMSGTSAGGINAIYLAKALANNEEIDQLKQLWINEGDIALLLNDKKSVGGLNLANQSPPQSLLNSRRMYLKLLKSLCDMGNGQTDSSPSSYVDELDLYITTTDIEGVPVPIRLSDTIVYERRHRNVFHFQYATPEATGRACNDFVAQNNPFLAYAARCTSSFPFAFEPMRLSDIDEVLGTFPEYRNQDYVKLKEEWTRFFRDYTDPGQANSISYLKRSFGDGGYLDNKPFTYATESLAHRHAPVPVDRKLIYIEPSPEHPEDEPNQADKPDALQNVKAAVLDLPTYETVREDLQRVINRNGLINRVNRISTAIERDLDQSFWSRPILEPGEWATLDLAGMVDRFGIYYLPYRRLRIASTTDELAKLVARMLNRDENSAQFFAIRSLVRAWREVEYPDYHPAPAETKEESKSAEDGAGQETTTGLTANQFLIEFDFKYWLRRLIFIRRKIDQFYRLLQVLPSGQNGDGLDLSQLTDQQKAIVSRLRSLKYNPLDFAQLTLTDKEDLQGVLAYLKCEVGEVYRRLRIAGRSLESAVASGQNTSGEAFAAQIKGIKIGKELLDFLLGMPGGSDSHQPEFAKLDEDQCVARARALLDATSKESKRFGVSDFGQDFKAAATTLKQVLAETVVEPTWTRCKELLKADKPLPKASGACQDRRRDSKYANSIREYLWRYFSQFDDFDQISFPILYGTEVGESDVVEIIRISPEDAVSLINERRERKNSADGRGRQKLAGTALHHFGAFMDRTWRQNDIMWGRLDGAERLITALLPEPENQDVRAELIKEAHKAILTQELPPEDRLALGRLMTDALLRASAGEPIEKAIGKVIANMGAESSIKTRLERVMRTSLDDEELLQLMATSYQVNRQIDPKSMLQALSRSTQVIGHLFEDIADRNSLDGKSLAWIARLGQVFWGLVQVAVPNSLLNLLVFHWLRVLYVFEIVLILGATLLASPNTLQFAWTAFGITAAVNVTILMLRDRMRLKKGWLYLFVSLFIFALLFFTAVGVDDVFQLGFRDRFLSLIQTVGSRLGWT